MAAKDRGANNRPMAIAGLIASVAAPIIYTVVALNYFGLSDRLAEKSVGFSGLSIGDCVLEPAGWNDNQDELESSSLKVVPCGNEHWGQVYFIEDVQAATYPGDDAMDAKSVESCESDAAINNVDPELLAEHVLREPATHGDSWEAHGRVGRACSSPESGPLSAILGGRTSRPCAYAR